MNSFLPKPDSNSNEIPTNSMDTEIRLVSRFHALTLSRNIVSIFLLVFIFMTATIGYRPSSPIYILAVMHLFPLPLEVLLAPRISKRSVVLPYLRKRYHYNSLRYAARSITSMIVCFLLILWQLHMNTAKLPYGWLRLTPVLLVAFITLFRFIAPYFLTKHISHRLLTGKY